jgi:hypothetical protein
MIHFQISQTVAGCARENNFLPAYRSSMAINDTEELNSKKGFMEYLTPLHYILP